MKFSLVVSLLLPAASAFVTPKSIAASKTSIANDLNGWQPDPNEFAFGLPGALDPVGNFDPLNISENTSLSQMKQYREAETTHGRVAMLAVIGFLVTEAPLSFHPLFNAAGRDIGPAIRHLDEVRATAPFFFEALALVIGGLELTRALKGWETPGNDEEKILKDDYYPGDIGFDPLNLKPDNFDEFAIMSTKELQHGRLAMLGIAGIVAQELVNSKEIFVTLGLVPDTFDASNLPIETYSTLLRE